MNALCLVAALLLADGDLELTVTSGNAPLRVRVQIESNGRPLAAAWEDAFAALTTFCDRNTDGHLDEAESRRLPSARALREVLSLGFTPQLGESLTWKELDADADGRATAGEVAALYHRAGLGQPVVGAGTLPFTDDLTTSLTKLLDTDGSGKVDAKELEKAPDLLTKLDRNDDELIGAGELVSRSVYPGAAGSQLLTAASSLKSFPVTLQPADAANDVESWQTAKGARSIAKPGVQISLRTDAGKLPAAATRNRERFASDFAAADMSADGVLSKDETAATKDATWNWLLPLADWDGDEQLARKELDAWLALQARLADCQRLISVLDAGRGLFELLDANHDGALSVAELRDAAKNVRAAGALESDNLDTKKLPAQLLITCSHGYPMSVLGTTAERTGPAWFLAMDRNADGSVSRREFSGPPAAFERLDKDRDGLLTAAESQAARAN